MSVHYKKPDNSPKRSANAPLGPVPELNPEPSTARGARRSEGTAEYLANKARREAQPSPNSKSWKAAKGPSHTANKVKGGGK